MSPHISYPKDMHTAAVVFLILFAMPAYLIR